MNRTMECSVRTQHDYETAWGRYAYEAEDNRFLSSGEEDLLEICDCVDLNDPQRGKTSGGIPIHYADGKLYVLKTGPHSRVQGQSGSKKSRTVVRGQAVSAVLNRDSFVLTDPKGEIYSDPKIRSFLTQSAYDVHVLDFRKFDKDGFNCLSYAFELAKKGQTNKALATLNHFVEMLKKSKKTNDDFWNDQAADLIRFVLQMLEIALLQTKNGEAAFNLSSVKSFIRQDRDQLRATAESILRRIPRSAVHNPVRGYYDILENPEKTYACIVSSANAMLSEFCSSEDLLRMLSVQTFHVREMYQRPTALFIVVPDEVSTYDAIVGYLIDTFYQILVDEFGEVYQNQAAPRCSIKFICDEVASLRINDMASKISASRSREIDWTLIYQSDRQMQQAYEKDWGAICGNCQNAIFLGSTDYEILHTASEQVGQTRMTASGSPEPLISVADLRRMRKERTYKDALVITGNFLYCARLPDYDVYPFLKIEDIPETPQPVSTHKLSVYTPEMLLSDFREDKISFSEEQRPRAESLRKNSTSSKRRMQSPITDFMDEEDN